MNRRLVLLLALTCGVAVGNVYFPQAISPSVASGLNATPDSAALVVTAAQFGYAAGIFLLVPLGDRLPHRTLIVLPRRLGLRAPEARQGRVPYVGRVVRRHRRTDRSRCHIARLGPVPADTLYGGTGTAAEEGRRCVNRLVTDGLIAREDGSLAITAEGQALTERLGECMQQTLTKFLGGWSADQYPELSQHLARYRDSSSAMAPSGTSSGPIPTRDRIPRSRVGSALFTR